MISSTSSAVRRMSGTSLVSISPASCAAFTVSVDSDADLGGGRLAALGELAHFGGHDREALAVLAGARRLHRRVERQQVGLAGDLLHDGDLLGDRLHRLDGAADRLAAALRRPWRDWRAIFSVWPALSAFCLMLAAISSIEAEASSAAEACSVAPWESCSALAESSWLPAETLLRGRSGVADDVAQALRPSSFSAVTRSPISSSTGASAIARSGRRRRPHRRGRRRRSECRG